jgi:hypothetical protein
MTAAEVEALEEVAVTALASEAPPSGGAGPPEPEAGKWSARDEVAAEVVVEETVKEIAAVDVVLA